MKSMRNLQEKLASIPLLSDDILEFHAARLLLLIRFCGKSDRIEGLTKMAKLDFFVRYPRFFTTACEARGQNPSGPVPGAVESSMVRYHYGPWDQRYYHVLAYLEARGLIVVEKDGKAFKLALTPFGKEIAGKLSAEPSYATLVQQMRRVKSELGSLGGSGLKNLIYKVFAKEVAERRMGEVIR